MASRPLLVVGLIFAAIAGGCAHDTLGAPPTDLDLRNDGAPLARSHLYRTYQVTYGDGRFRRPSSGELTAAAESDEAANYLNTSLPARAELETGAVAFDRFMHSGSLYTVTAGVGMSIGLVSGLSATLPLAYDAMVADRSSAPKELLGVSKAAGLGALVGVVAAIPVVWLIDLTVNPVVRSVAAADYREAANAFNADLQKRIDKAADPSLSPKKQASENGVDL